MVQAAVNIEIITRFEYAFRAGDQATIDTLCDPGLVDHTPAPDEAPTLAGFKQKAAGFKAIFPDLQEECRTSSPAAMPSPPGGSLPVLSSGTT